MEASGLGRAKRIALLDTNTLIYIAEGIIPLSRLLEETGYPKLATTSKVLEELKSLSQSPKLSLARKARLALALIERLGVDIMSVDAGNADDSIEAAARMLKTSGSYVVVATSDRSLRSRLRRIGVPTAYYRESRGGVELEWDLP